jgi:hypothetical protein
MDFPHLRTVGLRMTGPHPGIFSCWAAVHGWLIVVMHSVLQTVVHGWPVVIVRPILWAVHGRLIVIVRAVLGTVVCGRPIAIAVPVLCAAVHGWLIAVVGRVRGATVWIVIVRCGRIVGRRFGLLVLIFIFISGRRERNGDQQEWDPLAYTGPYQLSENHLLPPWVWPQMISKVRDPPKLPFTHAFRFPCET